MSQRRGKNAGGPGSSGHRPVASAAASANEPTQRQLRVGELVKHILADSFIRNSVNDPELDTSLLTVTEVRLSPDLKAATAFIVPLGGIGDVGQSLRALERNSSFFRRKIGAQAKLKFTPRLNFKSDNSFDTAQEIDRILRSPAVSQDLVDDRVVAKPED